MCGAAGVGWKGQRGRCMCKGRRTPISCAKLGQQWGVRSVAAVWGTGLFKLSSWGVGKGESSHNAGEGHAATHPWQRRRSAGLLLIALFLRGRPLFLCLRCRLLRRRPLFLFAPLVTRRLLALPLAPRLLRRRARRLAALPRRCLLPALRRRRRLRRRRLLVPASSSLLVAALGLGLTSLLVSWRRRLLPLAAALAAAAAAALGLISLSLAALACGG